MLCHRDLVRHLLQIQLYAVCSHGGILSPDSVCHLLQMYLHTVSVVAGRLCPQDLVCDWLQMLFLRRVVTGVNCYLLLIDLNVLIREGECHQVIQGYSEI